MSDLSSDRAAIPSPAPTAEKIDFIHLVISKIGQTWEFCPRERSNLLSYCRRGRARGTLICTGNMAWPFVVASKTFEVERIELSGLLQSSGLDVAKYRPFFDLSPQNAIMVHDTFEYAQKYFKLYALGSEDRGLRVMRIALGPLVGWLVPSISFYLFMIFL